MLTVSDLMTLDPRTVSPTTLLGHVIELMQLEGCRQLPVLDDRGRLVGIVSDRDIRLMLNSPLIMHDRSQDEAMLNTVTAAACMTPDPITVQADTAAYRAAEMLSAYKFGALPVMNEGRLVGIITVTDFLDHFVETHGENVVEAESG